MNILEKAEEILSKRRETEQRIEKDLICKLEMLEPNLFKMLLATPHVSFRKSDGSDHILHITYRGVRTDQYLSIDPESNQIYYNGTLYMSQESFIISLSKVINDIMNIKNESGEGESHNDLYSKTDQE